MQAKLMLVALWIALPFIGGCGTLSRGGAPDQSFDLNKDLKDLQDKFGAATSVAEFYKDGAVPTEEGRNRFIAGRLIVMNIRYIQFVRETTKDKQLLDSASDALVLSLNLAATALTPNSTKTILSAISAGIGGTKTIVDKEFFYDKTLPALVASMDAQRKQALIPILEGRKRSIEEYPLEQAIIDLDQYYEAGTFYGAIRAIQADASTKQAKANASIRQLGKITRQDIATIDELFFAIDGLTDQQLASAKSAYRALRDLDPTPQTDAQIDAITTIDPMKTKLKDMLQEEAVTAPILQRMKATFLANSLIVTRRPTSRPRTPGTTTPGTTTPGITTPGTTTPGTTTPGTTTPGTTTPNTTTPGTTTPGTTPPSTPAPEAPNITD